jgi:hypothetical protein
VKVYANGSIQFNKKKQKEIGKFLEIFNTCLEIIEISDDENEIVTEDDVREWLEIFLQSSIVPTEQQIQNFANELETTTQRVKKLIERIIFSKTVKKESQL